MRSPFIHSCVIRKGPSDIPPGFVRYAGPCRYVPIKHFDILQPFPCSDAEAYFTQDAVNPSGPIGAGATMVVTLDYGAANRVTFGHLPGVEYVVVMVEFATFAPDTEWSFDYWRGWLVRVWGPVIG